MSHQLIKHSAEIIQVRDGIAQVRIVQQSACSGCHAKSVCQVSESKEKILDVPVGGQSFAPGETVFIEGSTRMGLKAVLYAFVIPMTLLIGMIALGLHAWSWSESLAALIGMAVLCVYYLGLYFLRDKFRREFVFRIVKE
ncbi:SoxR reducing system RseC family protein [Bacteroidales bacterium OttesenSCG-928-L03]|nr:SoxR reducing system RseC family protein [Bacteroidales bacterium OttesenSCG-928-L03]